MVQSNTPGFSLENIFAKLAESFPDPDPESFKELNSIVTDEQVTDDRELTIVLH